MSLILKNKIPLNYFFFDGGGQSNYGGRGLPFEAGSYDGALNQARIQNANIMKYTSVIPKESHEITRSKGLRYLHWGCVLDTIMAQMNGKKGDHITAAIMITRIHNPKGKYVGSFACEYAGYGGRNEAAETVLHDIEEMIQRRGMGKTKTRAYLHRSSTTSKGYKFKPDKFIFKHMIVRKRFGTVIAGLGFVNYSYPIIKDFKF